MQKKRKKRSRGFAGTPEEHAVEAERSIDLGRGMLRYARDYRSCGAAQDAHFVAGAAFQASQDSQGLAGDGWKRAKRIRDEAFDLMMQFCECRR